MIDETICGTSFLLSFDFILVLDAAFAEMSETYSILQAIVLTFMFFEAILSLVISNSKV